MKLSKERAEDYAYGNVDPESDPYSVESNEQVDRRRWVSIHQLVLKDKAGLYWATTYERGLTEYQDIEPFEDAGEEVEFNQVAKIPVLTYEYKGMGLEGGDSEPAGDSPDSPATPESRVLCPTG